MFKAAYIEKQNQPLLIDSFELPNPDYGQLLVKFHNSGICGRQIQEIYGYKGEDKFLPHFLGHEGTAEVLKIGTGVSKCSIGDTVIAHWRESKGIAAGFPKYKLSNSDKFVGGGLVTTFNEISLISENRVTKIPNNVDKSLATLLGCSLSTGLGIINKELDIKLGSPSLVIGCGSVGLSALIGLSLTNSYPLIAMDINTKKLNLSRELGANKIYNIKDLNLEDIIDKLKSDGISGFDNIIDTTGIPENINLAYNILNKEGTLCMVGQPKIDQKIILTNLQTNFQGKKIFDSQGGLTNPDTDFLNYINLFEKYGDLFSKIITDRCYLNNLNEYLEKLKNNSIVGKIILEFT